LSRRSAKREGGRPASIDETDAGRFCCTLMTMSDRIGFIGLGVMGKPMARNLLARGFSLVVHNRSRGAVDELAAAGAEAASSPAEVAGKARVILTMVPDSPDVVAVLEGPNGVFSALQPGSVIVDHSTIAPAVARRLAERAKTLGASMLDAPVSGGEVGAINASLSIMIGGDAADVERVRPILEAMGNAERIIHIGASGSGQLCKVCNQMVIGGTLAAVSEAFALARKADVDASRVRAALLGGFASSRVLEAHGERILQSNYKPGFRTRLFAKDLRIAADTLAEHQTPAPVAATVQQLVVALMASGKGDVDYSALATVLFDLAGIHGS
jgi:2-hydroxy-3-oxopropionate reductase